MTVDVLTERDRAVFEKAGFGRRGGLGSRPAILVVDVTYRFCGEAREPILRAVERWRTSCGETAWDAIDVLTPFLDRCRDLAVPLYFTRGWTPGDDGSDLGRWRGKSERIDEDVPSELERGNQIIEELGPRPGDVVVEKGKPSAFFGTHLLSFLIDRRIDTLVVCGTTTSGCVRATVVDAFSYNFHVAVLREGTFDRGETSHAASMFDMDQKYADVMSVEDVEAYLRGLEAARHRDG